MVTEKMVYWIMVGVLALGTGNSLSRNIDAARVIKQSRAEFQLLTMGMGKTTGLLLEDGKSNPNVAACPRTVRMNLEQVRRDAVVVRLDSAQHRRDIGLRDRAKMVMVVSE